MRTAFITGAYGMVGSWIVRALLDRGVRVVVLKRDQLSVSALELEGLEGRCAVVHGDLLDGSSVGRAIAEYECDSVFHLAAQPILGKARRSPLSTWESNVRGTYLVMEECRIQEVERVVVAASVKVYGPHHGLPYVEQSPLQPSDPYDVSKACTDLIVRSYAHTYGVPAATTRFANIYGGGDLNPSRLVPELVAGVLRGRAPVIRSDGSPERDFLFAADAAAAYLAIADHLGPGGDAAGEAFNAGGDAPHSVREVVETLLRVTGSELRADFRGTGTPDGEIDRQWVSSAKLRALTGWRPQVELEEGLRRTVEWYRGHPEALGAG